MSFDSYACPSGAHKDKIRSDIPLPRGMNCWACGGVAMVKVARPSRELLDQVIAFFVIRSGDVEADAAGVIEAVRAYDERSRTNQEADQATVSEGQGEAS